MTEETTATTTPDTTHHADTNTKNSLSDELAAVVGPTRTITFKTHGLTWNKGIITVAIPLFITLFVLAGFTLIFSAEVAVHNRFEKKYFGVVVKSLSLGVANAMRAVNPEERQDGIIQSLQRTVRHTGITEAFIMDNDWNIIYHNNRSLQNQIRSGGTPSVYNSQRSQLPWQYDSSGDIIVPKPAPHSSGRYVITYPVRPTPQQPETLIAGIVYRHLPMRPLNIPALNTIVSAPGLSAYSEVIILGAIIVLLTVIISFILFSSLYTATNGILQDLLLGLETIKNDRTVEGFALTNTRGLTMQLAAAVDDVVRQLRTEQLYNKRKFESDTGQAIELTTFTVLKTELFPLQPQRFEDYSIDFYYKPSESLSGAVAKVFKISDVAWGLFLGQMQKGSIEQLGVALSVMFAELENLRAHHSSTPAAVLKAMNHHLARISHNKVPVSCALAVLDAYTNLFEFASSGGVAVPLYQKKMKSLLNLNLGGFPLGNRNDDDFQATLKTETIRLDNGDAAVFISDGVLMAKNKDGEQFGLTSVNSIIKNNAGKSAGQIIAAFNEKLSHFIGTIPQENDLLVMVLKKGDSE